jgi:hypothetical protein
MSKMLRKSIANTGVCMYGEKCCAPFPIDGKSGSKWKREQRQIARRREAREWRKDQ